MVYFMGKFIYYGFVNFYFVKSWLSRGYKLLVLRNKNVLEGSIVFVI